MIRQSGEKKNMDFDSGGTQFFKGWAKPGPQIPSLQESDLRLNENETLDALCGHFRIFQLKKGHRYSTDDLLTAWYGTSWCPSARRALDLGSGIGTVGMLTAWRLPGVHLVSVEAQEISVELAKKSVCYNQLEDRYQIRLGDFRDPNVLSPAEKFDLILGSPPYFPVESGIFGNHPQKIACRFEVRGNIQDYCHVASEHLEWGGLFACVFPIQPSNQYQRVREAAQSAGLSVIRERPIIFKEGQAPLIGVFAMALAHHLPESFRDQSWKEPPLIIRNPEGKVHPEYARVKMTMGLPPT